MSREAVQSPSVESINQTTVVIASMRAIIRPVWGLAAIFLLCYWLVLAHAVDTPYKLDMCI